MRPEDVAWLAGLFEGEGCINVSNRPERKTQTVLIQVGMSDRDVMERAASLLGAELRTCKPARDHYKDMYYARLFGEPAVAWLADMYQYLGERRQRKAMRALQAYSAGRSRAREDDMCRRGHLMEPENVYAEGRYQRCRRCALDGMKSSFGRVPPKVGNAA